MPAAAAATLPLFPEMAAPSGIAGLAAAAELDASPNTISYHLLTARTLLSRCQSKRMPFDWTLNPYRGCEFACRYCYARYTHEFMELRDPEAFERRIFVKQQAAELLRRDLRKVAAGEWIALGTATDPYQPAERHYRVTRSLLEVLAERSGLRLSVVTKSQLVTRDLDLWKAIAAGNELALRITVTTANVALARALEPRAPRPDLRLRAVAELRAAGLNAGVICAPVLPGITDGGESLGTLMAAAKAADAQFFDYSPLFLQPSAQAVFFPFVRERFPQLWQRYEKAFARGAYLGGEYRRRLRDRVDALRAEHGC